MANTIPKTTKMWNILVYISGKSINFAYNIELVVIMESTRIQKIQRLIQKDLSEIFREDTSKMRGVIVSVSNVRVSPDLSIARVHLSVFPSERAQEIVDGVNKNVKTIRYALAQRVRNQLRKTPDLVFYVDDSLDYIEHIDELLKK